MSGTTAWKILKRTSQACLGFFSQDFLYQHEGVHSGVIVVSDHKVVRRMFTVHLKGLIAIPYGIDFATPLLAFFEASSFLAIHLLDEMGNNKSD
jgi:hypothetical protein